MEDVVWFSQIGKEDVGQVGGKGANLGELSKIGVPIPEGFIITSQAYFRALQASGALDRIRGILYDLDVEDPTLLQKKALACQKEIKAITLEGQLERKIVDFYQKLEKNTGNSLVAVRSSATAEDLPEASFAGQQATFLNVKGKRQLIAAVSAVWASLFEARAIYYRTQKKFDHFSVGIALPVQKMIQSEASGVLFTVDPVENDKNKIIIEAIFGLGELIVGGQVTPDHYQIDKRTFKIIAKNIVSQEKQLVKGREGNRMVNISKPYRRLQKLSDEKIVELARIASLIEKHYFFPQDIEWAYQGGRLFIVQTRPVTTLKRVFEKPQIASFLTSTAGKEPILQGAPASPIIATGKVIVVKSPKELSKIQRGDVLVAPMTSPDYVQGMKKAVAVVTDHGGRTSHAAIVSRELGIACVVGCGEATKKLKDGMVVTVDGQRGLVFAGQITKSQKQLNLKPTTSKSYKTATKLLVNMADPTKAAEIASRDVDGVGLLRAEFVLAQIGTHPKSFLERGKKEEFIENLTSYLAIFAKAFGSRPVIYRASDLKSNEYRNLGGGDRWEPHEANPMLGYRGAFRYIKDPDVFKLELEAIAAVRKKYANLHLMIPFVRTPQELRLVRTITAEYGLFEDSAFQFWMMVEIPSNVIRLEDFIRIGIDGVSIGSNDLTMLILGTDRDNSEMAREFYEMDKAVLWALAKTIKTARRYRITCSICGQAPSNYPDLTDKLVSWGINSISVNPDAIDSTRELIYQAEHKLIAYRKKTAHHGKD